MVSDDGPPFSVLVHPYRSPTRGACAYELGEPSSPNALVFVGGLKDGPHTTPFVRTIADSLSASNVDLGYSLFEFRLRSSFTGFGTSSLEHDVEDMAALVTYLRGLGRKKIVFMGHSTGSQDCMAYARAALQGKPRVEGFILQAPVSDQEAFQLHCPEYQGSIELAKKWIDEGRANDCLPDKAVPDMLDAPISAYRFWSICAEGGDDDYFSSYLDDEAVSRIWGPIDRPVLVLHSENDEFVPKHVDQASLNKRYLAANPLVSQLSGLIPGTGHTVLEDAARQWLAATVVKFLRALDE